jgi:hypothetical protein
MAVPSSAWTVPKAMWDRMATGFEPAYLAVASCAPPELRNEGGEILAQGAPNRFICRSVRGTHLSAKIHQPVRVP